MKYQATDAFIADYAWLSPHERALFQQAVSAINDAYAARGNHPLPRWPAKLRVKRVQGASGIWEMTRSFAVPDGRATFELTTIDDEPALRWRRIGGHDIFQAP